MGEKTLISIPAGWDTDQMKMLLGPDHCQCKGKIKQDIHYRGWGLFIGNLLYGESSSIRTNKPLESVSTSITFELLTYYLHFNLLSKFQAWWSFLGLRDIKN